jgi:probable rRNA maturation factor
METTGSKRTRRPDDRARILIADLQDKVAIPAGRIRRLAGSVIAGEKLGAGALSIAFVDRATMRRVNRQFLKHDFDTDVLAFPLGGPLIGELVISTAYALKEAKSRRLPVHEELSRYVVHGILHLAGYDDHKPADKARMWERQEAYLNKR